MKICKECPFKRESLPGYLGDCSYEPERFLDGLQNHVMPCHMSINWDAITESKIKYKTPCKGSLIYLKNIMVLPVNKEYAALRNSVEPDETIFKTRAEFIKYHKDEDSDI